jgi:hypothetical protein
MIRYSRQRRARRRNTVFVLLSVVLLAAIILSNCSTDQLRFIGLSGAAVADEVEPVAQTQVVPFMPALPAEEQPGVCEGSSLLVPRSNAWRCTASGVTYDPCIAVPGDGPEDAPSVVCGADPVTGAPGFHLLLDTPIAPAPATLAQVRQPYVSSAALANLDYPLDLIGGSVRLVNGQYYARTTASASSAVLVALGEMQARGDFNGDGHEDVATLLVVDPKDGRMLIYLAAIAAQNGAPTSVRTLLLGDRVQVNRMHADNGQLRVDLMIHAAGDQPCCPTLETTHYYNFGSDGPVQYVDALRLELADGTFCAAEASGRDAAGNQAPAYRCGDGTWLRRGLVPGPVWSAQRTGGLDPANSLLPIRRLWQ